MEPILNELSLVPVARPSLDERLAALVAALKALRELGAARVLRSTADAIDREVSTGSSLRTWLNSLGGHREVKQLLKSALNKAPFVEKLHADAEGDQAIEVRVREQLARGLGAALLLRSTAVSLPGLPEFDQSPVDVSVSSIDSEENVEDVADHVLNVWGENSVAQQRQLLTECILRTVSSGMVAWRRRSELFERLDWSKEGQGHLCALDRSATTFAAVIHSLVLLSQAAKAWTGGPFAPPIRYSVESGPTLDHPDLGRLRDCTFPSGEVTRLSLHVKLHSGWRVYYAFHESASRHGRVTIGYLGPHLPTARDG